MLIKKVKVSEHGELVSITLFSDKEMKLTVFREIYDSVGAPMPSDTVTDDVYTQIIFGDECYRAVKKALSLLSFSDNSKSALKRKLTLSGFSRDASSYAVDYAVSLGYINELDALKRLVAREASTLTGPRKICAKLVAKGYSASDVRRALKELTESCEIDFEDNFARLKEKRLVEGASDEEIRKLKFKFGY